jgi:chaperone modulatory protein CbpM
MMAGRDRKPLEGILLDEETKVSLTEICKACGVHAETITEMVDYGILEPVGGDVTHWRFSGTSLRRVSTVVRLQRDLGVNLAGAALALDLLDQLAELRRQYDG